MWRSIDLALNLYLTSINCDYLTRSTIMLTSLGHIYVYAMVVNFIYL